VKVRVVKRFLQRKTWKTLFGFLKWRPKVLSYLHALRCSPLQPQTVLLWMQDETDEPVLQATLQHADFKNYHIICVVAEEQACAKLREHCTAFKRVTLLASTTFAAYRALATAGVILFTTPVDAFYTKRQGQVVFVAFETFCALRELTIPMKKAKTRMFFLADVLLPCSVEAMQDFHATFLHNPSLVAKLVEGGLEAVSLSNLPKPTSHAHILFYVDTLKLNGITASLMNLLQLLVDNGIEVSLMTQQRQAFAHADVLERIPKGVALLPRWPALHLTLKEAFCYSIFQRLGESSWVGRWVKQTAWWQEEARRMVGDTAFTCAIEYSGYTASGAMLTLAMKARRHLIWAHADMMSEYKLKHPRLKAVFSLYAYFDAFVSCSEALRRVNEATLENALITFAACKNALNVHRVQRGLSATRVVYEHGGAWLVTHAMTGEEKRIALDLALPSGGYQRPTYRFLMVGRLSIEKNIEAALRGFALFLKKGFCAKLFIVGEGPLKDDIQTLISTLHLDMHVELVGQMENPAEMMKVCDCFLLTSRHEGQPMVVNEARIAGIPIILTNFASHTDVLLLGGQKVVEMDAESIATGYEAFARGERWPYTFDAESYNQAVFQAFSQLALV
jgi:glycosyltransferase involved in cell wall biosynthesis